MLMVEGQLINKTQYSGARRNSLGFAAVALTAVWLLLSDFDLTSLLVGIPSIGLALWCYRCLHTSSSGQLSFVGALRLAVFFLHQSLIGGWDLACRSCGKRVRVNPGLIEYRPDLNCSAAYPLFVRCLNLLPGTLSVEDRQESLLIHVIDTDVNYVIELERLAQLTEAVWCRSAGGGEP